MPYLLPEDALQTELGCILIFYPDREEYRQALLGQVAELTDVWNWEGTRENQALARESWLLAELETLANMGCFDEVVTRLDAITDLMEDILAKDVCCETVTGADLPDDSVGYDESTLPDDVDVDGEVIPDGYADVDEYQQYLCGVALQLAGSTDAAVDTINDVLLVASNIIVFATLLVLAFGNVIGMGIAAILAGGYSLVTVSEIFGFFSLFTELREVARGEGVESLANQTKAELAAIHDELVEAVACANSAHEARSNLHTLLDNNVTDIKYRGLLKVAWSLPVMRALFAGYSEAAPSTECDCIDAPAYSNYTRFGSDFDGTGDWTGGADLDTDRKRYRSTQLTLVIPPGYRVNGRTLRITATVMQFVSGEDTQWRVGYAGNPDQEQFTFPITVTPTEYVREHTIVGTNLTHEIVIRFRNNSGVTNHAVYEALVEILDDGD